MQVATHRVAPFLRYLLVAYVRGGAVWSVISHVFLNSSRPAKRVLKGDELQKDVCHTWRYSALFSLLKCCPGQRSLRRIAADKDVALF
jgi:hypothetical protein